MKIYIKKKKDQTFKPPMALSGEEAGVLGRGPAPPGTGHSGFGVRLEEVEGRGI